MTSCWTAKAVWGAIFILVLGLAVGPSALAQEVRITIGHISEPTSLYHVTGLHFKELVETRSNGRIRVDIFPQGQLGSQTEMLEMTAAGTLDMVIGSTEVVGFEESFGIFDLPYLFDDRAHVARFVHGPGGKDLAERIARKNIVLLAFWENGFRHMTNNRQPIRVPSDLNGLKMRTPPSPARLQMFRTWGANPVQMSFNELFSALQQGVVDGQENPLAQIVSASLYEVQQYISYTGHVYTPSYLLASASVWNRLPEWARDILATAAVEAGDFSRATGQQMDDDYAKLVVEQGMIANDDVDREAFRQSTLFMYDEFSKRFGPDLLRWAEEAR